MKSIHISLITFIAGLGAAFAQLPTATESPLIEHPVVEEDRSTLEWGVQNCSEAGDGTEPPYFNNCEFVIRKETGAGVFENFMKVIDLGPGQGSKLVINEVSPLGPTTIDLGGISTDQVTSTEVTSINSFANYLYGDVVDGGLVDADFVEADNLQVGWFDLIGGGGSINMNQGSGGGPQIGVGLDGGPHTFIDGNGITTAEVRTAKWKIATPDYVFEPDFQLKPLPEVEKFVRENKHLPDIPSGQEFEKEGLELATMSMLLLKKVEELTLYTIDQDKVIRAQHQNIAEQKAQLDELRRQVTALLKEGK